MIRVKKQGNKKLNKGIININNRFFLTQELLYVEEKYRILVVDYAK